MAFNNTLQNAINAVVGDFIDQVATKYGLNTDELQLLWDKSGETGKAVSRQASKKTSSPVADLNMDDITPERINACNVAELKALCKAHGHKCGGRKAVLVARLLGLDEENPPDVPRVVKKVVKKSRAAASTQVVKSLTANLPVIPARRNAFGNIHHPETNLIFDMKSKCAIGTQNDDGSIDPLNDDSIELCKKFNMKYKIPDNLDGRVTLDDVKVDELELEDDSDDSDDSDDDIDGDIDDEPKVGGKIGNDNVSSGKDIDEEVDEEVEVEVDSDSEYDSDDESDEEIEFSD